MSYEVFIGEVMKRLAGVGVCLRGEAARDDNTQPPLYVFTWRGIREATEGHAQFARTAGAARPLQVDEHEVEVTIWSKAGQIEAMRNALVKAVRLQCKGRRYRLGESVPNETRATSAGGGLTLGVRMRVTLYIYLDLEDVILPAETPAVAAAGTPTILPATLPTAPITNIENSTGGQTPGDGVLELGEP